MSYFIEVKRIGCFAESMDWTIEDYSEAQELLTELRLEYCEDEFVIEFETIP